MNKYIRIITSFIVLVALGFFVIYPVYASTKYESFESGDDASYSSRSVRYLGQEITPAESHTITSVWIYGLRGWSGSETVDVEVREMDDTVLCSGSEPSSSWNNGTPNWVEVELSPEANLYASTHYRICVIPDTIIAGHWNWRVDSDDGYSGGDLWYYVSSWTQYEGRDGLFRVYGNPLGAGDPPDGVTSFSLTREYDDSITANWSMSDTATGVQLLRDWSDYPSANSTFILYSGNSTSYSDNCGLPMFLTWHYSIYEYNDAGWSGGEYAEIGGDDMSVELSFPIGVLLLILGVVLTIANFFFKHPLIYLALVAIWFGVFFSPDMVNTWVQWVSILMVFWSGIGFFYRLSVGRDKGY